MLTVLSFIFSCEEQPGLFIRCDECWIGEPLEANLDIKLTSFDNATVTGVVYEGNIEDSVVYSTFYTSGIQRTETVLINKKYTVAVTYYIGNKKFIAIDSATPAVKYDKYSCDDPCYIIYNYKIDLRLKSTD